MADADRSARPVAVLADTELVRARQRLDAVAARVTSTVGYVSGGHCLVVGAPERAFDAAARLARHGGLGATLVHVDPGASRVDKALAADGTALYTVPALRLEGHLGAFVARALAAGAETDLGIPAQRPGGVFDLVLDLGAEPLLVRRLPPFGYVRVAPSRVGGGAGVADGDGALEAAIATLAGLVGEFDKPRYFAYERAICAHSRSALAGCSNCIEVCVAEAIRDDGDGVAVDPYLCQGCGSCATLCPSGAMVYAYPKPSDAIARSREALAASGATTLLLHGEGAAAAVAAAALPGDVLALAVEEVSAFGIDYWATMLCAGVGRLLLVSDAAADDPNRRALESQTALLERILGALGVTEPVVQLVPSAALADVAALPGPAAALVALAPARFATHDDKRATLRAALETLAAALPPAEPATALPPGAPFGRIAVDAEACTLCMACVSTCPAGALLDGQDSPALRLIEANCVQCGLCAKACPENAVTLEPRYLHDGVAARRIETLNKDAPFRCTACHKPFATRRIIETMLGKLSGHWMFGDERARRRLTMCEDCRVRDIFREDAGGIDLRGGPAADADGSIAPATSPRRDGPKDPD